METIKGKSIQIIFSALLLLIAFLIDSLANIPFWATLLIYIIPYLVASFDVFQEALEGLKEKNIFNEHILMIIATLGGMFIGFIPNANPECLEGVLVMVLFQMGELFEIIAENQSKKSIDSIMRIKPEFANLATKSGYVKTNPNNVKINDVILVNPGEKIPLDGVIIEGKSSLNTVAITGESLPKYATTGDCVCSGYINLSGVIKIKVCKTFEDSTVSKIIELVQSATKNKSKSDKFTTKFSKYYTPTVVIIAFLLAIIPSIITGNFAVWISRALTFLVISCPCALVISVPLSYFSGIGCSAKKGILIKGAKYLEQFANLKTLVFDKTGTLTEGVFDVVAIHPEKYTEEELLHLATHVEYHSNHPIAQSLKEYYDQFKDIQDACVVENVEEIAGFGVKAKVNDSIIYVGNQRLMSKLNIKVKPCSKFGTIIHIATEKEYLGHIVIADKIKEDSLNAIKDFRKQGIKTVMLTGDKWDIAENVASTLGIDNFYAELLPEQKVAKMEEIMQSQGNNSVVAFVGDGINDAPSLARADIGISMGLNGTDSAIEASDVVLMEDRISKINTGVKISKKTQKIVKENILISLAVKFTVLGLAGFGLAPMLLAIFADVGVTIFAVLNAMRALKFN